jgi:hypothetical protein
LNTAEPFWFRPGQSAIKAVGISPTSALGLVILAAKRIREELFGKYTKEQIEAAALASM